jgi:thiol:disulfide interchange protein/DsbC/DsbD-like thiol-disulfide interchange protein
MRPTEGPFMLRLLLALLLLPLVAPAFALESTPVVSKRATVTLVSDTDAISAGTPFRAGLRFRLAEGWHTYWKNPGDAGVPAELVFALPDGASAGPIDWPAPTRIAEGPMMTYAYNGEILLPAVFRTAGPLTLKAHANWLVCKDICVPEEGDFTLVLPAGTPAPNAQAALFAAHERSVPRPSPWEATIAADGSLFVHGAEARAATDAWFIPDAGGRIVDSAPQLLRVRDDGLVLSLKLAPDFKPAEGLTGILSVMDRSGMRSDLTVSAKPGAPPPAVASLPRVLLFAFLGGLILNLMPCVFPILAMKAVGLVSGVARGAARMHAVFYTAGVLVTFGALAGALLAARAAGAVAGWGFQFQSPVFVVAMVWVLFAVGLNLSGVFQIGSGLMGAGGSLAAKSGHWGDFFTGLLAVLVATPCTAPFMGVAIAAGLSAAPPVTIAVFLSMGMGLAAPYLLLGFVPGLGRLLPRPGRWMDVLKQALAFPMYGAAVWLLWVASQEAGSTGVLIAATGCALLGFAGWVWGVGQASQRPKNRRFAQALAVGAVLSALGILTAVAPAPAEPAAERGTEAFTPARLASARAAGEAVFVNMTAAWCVTCLVNERVAIRTDAVQRAFTAGKVLYLKGDWTRQSPEITAFLREHGRDGVPLYVYYPPGGAAPRILPQILTEGAVLAVLGAG